MRSFVVIGGCRMLVPQVLLALRSAGKFNCILLGGPDTRRLRYSLLCKERIEISIDPPDDAGVMQHLLAIAKREPDAMLLPVDCASVRMIKRMGEHRPLKSIPLPDIDVMDMLDDKWRFFEFCRRHGLNVPDTILLGSEDQRGESPDFWHLAQHLGIPFIVKPANEAGSKGVQVIHDEQQFHGAVISNPAGRSIRLIAQRFVAGIDVCIDLFSLQGRIRAMALRERIGARIRFFDNAQMRDIGERVAAASGYTGVMNLDARIEHLTGHVYLLESNPRYWATISASAGAGLNFVAASIAPPPDEAPVRLLTHGEFHTRHPLMRPSTWPSMLFDTSGHGRLLRAKMTDMQSVGGALKSIAVKPARMLPHLFARRRNPGLYEIQRR